MKRWTTKENLMKQVWKFLFSKKQENLGKSNLKICWTCIILGPAPKKKGLWMGAGLDDLDDEDLTDSSDEETEKGEKQKAVAKT